MLIANIYNFLRGYLKIRVTGGSRERFLNTCAKKHINIRNVRNTDGKAIIANIGIKNFRKMPEVCRSSSSRVHILSKTGVPFMLHRFLRREGLVFGFLMFVFLITWLCSHVWYIEIDESEHVAKEVIQRQLEMCGVYYGAPIREIDSDRVQAEMLNLNPKLAWLWTEIKGTKVTVNLRDRVQKPTIIEVDKPCNIIAGESGVLTSVLVKQGRSMVEKGMSVAKGQLLAGGVYDSKAIGYRSVHSEAEIYADVNIRLSGQYLLSDDKELQTGNYKKNVGIAIGKQQIFLPIVGRQYKSFVHEKEEHPFKVGNLYFPLTFIKNTYFQTQNTHINYEKEKIIEEGKEYLEKDLQNRIKNGMILEKAFTVSEIDENTVEVVLEAVCNMDIAQQQPIEEETVNGGNGNGA